VLEAFALGEQIKGRIGRAPAPQTSQGTTRTLIEVKSLSDNEALPDDHAIDVPVLGGPLRIIGQLNGTYILLASGDGLLIVDQHAAHERVMYEKLRRQINNGKVVAQELLEPLMLRLDASDAERILSVSPYLDELGFSLTSLGRTEVLISAYPEVLGRQASEHELTALIDEVVDIGAEYAGERFMDELVKVTACHSAIRAGQELSTEEISRLLEEMAATPNRYNCPHGRPTLVRVTQRELDLKFGRT
jgi:DNA mismatch repair protein MutL